MSTDPTADLKAALVDAASNRCTCARYAMKHSAGCPRRDAVVAVLSDQWRHLPAGRVRHITFPLSARWEGTDEDLWTSLCANAIAPVGAWLAGVTSGKRKCVMCERRVDQSPEFLAASGPLTRGLRGAVAETEVGP